MDNVRAVRHGERGIDRSEGGLGVGLTIVRRLVELHDGTVAGSSAGPGTGRTFTVRLPRADLSAAGGDRRTAARDGSGVDVDETNEAAQRVDWAQAGAGRARDG